MNKQVILTGLRANNDLHIGNYFGALLPMVDMANSRAGEYQINLFVPDLHSFTTPIDHKNLYAQTLHNLKIFTAAGLDLSNQDLFLYRQSYVPAHSELTWILDCFTGFGEMNRMTQFKDKSGKLSEDRISMGLLNYPVLMACDILLYGATYVPVGDDQSQHLEFTRNIAERMNNQFGQLFKLPKAVAEQNEFFGKDQGLRIRNLQNPSKKMSKSGESGRGIVFLGDNPDDAAKKIMGAETDSLAKIPSRLDYENQPGVSNLLQILALLSNRPVDEAVREYTGKSTYGELKSAVAEKVKFFLQEFQSKLAHVDENALQNKLTESEQAMNEAANKTLDRVQRAVGLRPTKPQSVHTSGVKTKPATINFDDFSKIDVRVGTVIAAEKMTGSDKLLKIQIDLGDHKRQILTGMQAFYQPEDFVGKQVPVLVNLAPRMMMGEESQGMLLALEGDEGPVFLTPEKPLPNGSPLE